MIRCLLLVDNYIEECEALVTRDLLFRSSIDVYMAKAIDDGEKIILSQNGHKFFVDGPIEDLNSYDCLVIPGGAWVNQTINNEVKVVVNGELVKDKVESGVNKLHTIISIIRHFNDQKRLVAAICAAPLYLNSAGLLTNNKFTCFPGVADSTYKKNYSATQKVVKSNNIITSRSVGAVIDFSLAIVNYLTGPGHTNRLKGNIVL